MDSGMNWNEMLGQGSAENESEARGEGVMKEFGIDDVFALICRNGGRMRYKDMAVAFEMDGSSMKLRNCLVKLRKRGLVQYIPSQSAWELTGDGRKKAGL